MSSYRAVAEYLGALLREKSGKVVLDSGRRVAVLDAGNYCLVFQAHDSKAWDLLKEVAKDPEKLKALFDAISGATETAIPSSITVMRVKKEDIRPKRDLK